MLPPVFRRVLAGAGAAALLAGGFGGCANSGERRDSIEAPVAALPTVNLPERAPHVVASADAVRRELGTLAHPAEIPGKLELLSRIDDPMVRARVAAEATTTVARRDVALAAAFAAALPAGATREMSVANAGREFAERDPAGALAWTAQFSDPAAALRARRSVIETLVAANPPSAIERVLALPQTPARDDLLVMAAATWARREPAAAIDWARLQPNEERKRRLLSAIGFELAQATPDRAIAVAQTLPAGRDRWLLFSAIAQTWVARDPKAALAWANQLPAGEPRDAAYAGIDTGLGMPSRRSIAAVPGIGGGRVRGGAVAGASPAWPEMSSPDFAAWLALQRPGLSRDEAILEYVRQRGALQPTAVGPWLASLPGGPARDEATRIFVEGLAATSPSDAARWITALPPSDRTDEMIERTARRWLLTNPVAAEAWLRASPLPPFRQDELLREAGR